ncbi:MAG TPA: hypothetical protein VF444_09415 [Pseudonocardiaceae bacterium]
MAGTDEQPPSYQEMQRRWAAVQGRKFHRKFPTAAIAPVIVVVLLLGVAGYWWWSSSHGGTATAGGSVPLPSSRVTDTMTVEQKDIALDLNQPFADTAAAGWADGANGIVLPAPAAVGKWTAAQVTDAENQVKQELVAANLDNRMLVNHDPSGYLALLAPDARTYEQRLLNDPSYRDANRVTQLAPGFHLLPAPIKVNGSMSAATNKDGQILIHTNYVFAYPFAPAKPATIRDSWEIVAIHHIQDDFVVRQSGISRQEDRGVWPDESQSYFAQMDCKSLDQGYLAPAYLDEQLSTGDDDTEDPDTYFDPSHPMAISHGCQS